MTTVNGGVYLDALLHLQGSKPDRDALAEMASIERTQLHNDVQTTLDAVGPTQREYHITDTTFSLSGTVNKGIVEFREKVLKHESEAGACELVMTDLSFNGRLFVSNRTTAGLYIRPVSRVNSSPQPLRRGEDMGELLFIVDKRGRMQGPVSDTATAQALVNMFTPNDADTE